MATNGGRINYTIGYSVDKTGLQELQSVFQRIANMPNNLGSSEKLNQGLIKASQTASKLDQILERTFNVNLGSLNVTKFNQELAKAGMTLQSVKSDLEGAGRLGPSAWARLSNAILGTNLQLKQSSKFLDSMALTLFNTAKWTVASKAINTITGSVQRAFSYSKNLDTSLNNIRITTQKSAENMAEFAKQANATAQALGSSTLDVTKSALTFYQQGKFST